MKPILSILVPAYNNQVYIRRCIESLMAQTLKDIEIILINDGSTDNTLAVMQEYAAQDDRIIIIDKLNSGYGVNINMGIQRAQGKYVGILESDDFCTPVAFEKLVNAAEKYDLEVSLSGNAIALLIPLTARISIASTCSLPFGRPFIAVTGCWRTS